MKMTIAPDVPLRDLCKASCNRLCAGLSAGVQRARYEVRKLVREMRDGTLRANQDTAPLPMTAHAYLTVGTLMVPEAEHRHPHA